MNTSQDNSKRNAGLPEEELTQGRVADLSSPSECRRRTFLKGAAAIPVIMTLPTGVAAAMSSIQVCAAKDQQQAAETQPAWITESTDTWVRKAVIARTIQMDNSLNVAGVAGTSFVVYQLDPNLDPNTAFTAYQPGLSTDNWLDQEGEHYSTIQNAQKNFGQDQTGLQAGTTQTVSEPVHAESQVISGRSSSIQVWTPPDSGKEPGVSTRTVREPIHTESQVISGRSSSMQVSGRSSSIQVWTPPDSGKEPGVGTMEPGVGTMEPGVGTMEPGLGKMRDRIGNTYSIVKGDATQYVIAQVDDQGRIVGFGSSTQFNHITGSCWASISPVTGFG